MKTFYKYPLLILVVIFAITVFFGLQLPNLKLDNDTAKFLPEGHPSRIAMTKMGDTYGSSMVVIIGMTFRDGLVYSSNNLALLDKITTEIGEEVEYVNKVTSIMNVDHIVGTADGIEAKKLVDKPPANAMEEKKIREKLLSWKPYRGNLFSEDFRSTTVLVKMKTGALSQQAETMFYQIMDILKKHEGSGAEFHVSGLPAIMVLINDNMKEDLARLIPFVVLILLVTLYLSFRRIGGVVLPTLTVLVSTVWLLGLMSLFGAKLTTIAVAIPVIMIAVGSAYGIHIVSHYYVEIAGAKPPIGYEKHRDIVFRNIKRVGGAVLLAALTTFFGFGSLVTSGVVPLIDFGIYTAVGTAIAFTVALTFIPSIQLLRRKVKPEPLKAVKKKPSRDGLGEFLIGMYAGFSKNRARAVVILVAVLAVSVSGTLLIKIGNPMIKQFKADTEIRKSDDYLNRNFSGTSELNILVKGEGAGSLNYPVILKAIEKLSLTLESEHPEVGAVISYVDLVKKINQIMNTDEKGDYYEIPSEPSKYRLKTQEELKQLIAQYLLIFSGNTSDYIDDPMEPSETKVAVMMKTADYDKVIEIEKKIREHVKENFPEGYRVEITGNADVQTVVSALVVSNKVWNIVSSLVAVFIILLLFYRSWMAALLGILTLALPILLNFGIMGFTGIHLDIGTSMVASISIGIGIDYTIHFLNAYYHERKRTGDLNEVTRRVFKSSGKAIVFNAVAVALGFAVMAFANEMPMVYFGILVTITMATAALSALTLLPFMLNTLKPKFMTNKLWDFMK